jgi:DNA-binding transcriptional LysR family regulator
VRIACSQALALDFLPREIAAFRERHALVGFDVKVLDHAQAIAALSAYEVGLVLVFRPPFVANFQPLMTLEQRLVAVMSAGYPLAPARPCGCVIARGSRCSAGAQHRLPPAAGGGVGAQRAEAAGRGRVEFFRVPARARHPDAADLVADPHRRLG